MSNASDPNAAPQANAPYISPSQRAAVVIAMLGEEAAKPIVDRMDDHAVVRIAASLETISYLPREQLTEIVMDFLRHLRESSGALRGGPDTTREFLSGVLDENRLKVIYGGVVEQPLEEQMPEPENKEDFSRLWGKFAKREPAHIVKYLSGLTPNIIGLILRNVDATLCSELICMMDEAIQPKILGELLDPPPASYEIDAVVARMVRMDFLLAPESEDEDDGTQLATVGEMLSLMPNERRSSLMNYVAESHASKLDQIQKGMFELSDIPKLLNRNFVPVLFKAMDQAFLLEALKCLEAQYAEVFEYLMTNISNRMADSLKTDLERVKAPTGEAGEQVEKDFLMKLMSLKRDGVIELERIEEEEEG